MSLRTILSIILLVALAACAGEDDTELAPEPTVEELPPPQVQEESEIEATIPVSGDPLQGTFEIEITGDIETTFSEGTAVYTSVETQESQQIPEYNELFFLSEDGLYQVTLLLPADTFAGTYDITGSSFQLEDVDETFTALFTDYENLDNETQSESTAYGSDVSGTITIEEIGESITGSFEFTAYAIGEGDTLSDSVTITGTFTNLELL